MYINFVFSAFTLKIWVSHYHGRGKVNSKNSRIVQERTVDLSDLSYLGSMVSQQLCSMHVRYAACVMMINCVHMPH